LRAKLLANFLLIDHHLDWEESNVGLISVGAETPAAQTGFGNRGKL
jgi:hypothetical protein